MFLSFLYPNNLLPLSLPYLISTLVCILFGFVVGPIVDTGPRIVTALGFLFLQKLAIAGAMISIWKMNGFTFSTGYTLKDSLDTSFWIMVFFTLLLKISNQGIQIIFERDWANAISTNENSLGLLNSNIRKVDLLCKLVAPIVISAVGSVITMGSLIVGMISFAAISCLMEWILLLILYSRETRLGQKKEVDSTLHQNSRAGLSTVVKDRLFLSIISIALLYLNVLAFGPVMISFLLNKIDPTTTSILRALAVMMGLLATFTFNKGRERIGLNRFGLWSIWSEFAFLSVAMASFLVKDSTLSLVLLLTGTSFSRWGLFSFDLVQTQILQQKYY